MYLLLFVLGLVLILIISPIKGHGRFDINSIYFKGSYLFGLISVSYIDSELKLRLLGFKINTSSNKDKKKMEDNTEIEDDTESKDDGTKKDKKKRSFKRPTKEVIVLTLELAKKLIKKIAPKKARLKLTLGLDEPYYTEMIHILSYVFFLPLNSIKNYDFSFQPINDGIAIDYEGEAVINVSIISLILPALRYLIRKPIRQYLNLSFKKKPKN
jgi:hypothetical protein